MAKPWFMFVKNDDDQHLFDPQGFIVPFGDTDYDVGFGGAHDLDIPAPPNSYQAELSIFRSLPGASRWA